MATPCTYTAPAETAGHRLPVWATKMVVRFLLFKGKNRDVRRKDVGTAVMGVLKMIVWARRTVQAKCARRCGSLGVWSGRMQAVDLRANAGINSAIIQARGFSIEYMFIQSDQVSRQKER